MNERTVLLFVYLLGIFAAGYVMAITISQNWSGGSYITFIFSTMFIIAITVEYGATSKRRKQ